MYNNKRENTNSVLQQSKQYVLGNSLTTTKKYNNYSSNYCFFFLKTKNN